MINKKLLIILISLSLVILFFAPAFYSRILWKYIPHKSITISLPFSSSDDYDTVMIPMGETINHNEADSPGGHPGIDFQWTRKVKILASSDGVVINISPAPDSEANFDLWIKNGLYQIRYKEMSELAPGIAVGSVVHQGDFLGYALKDGGIPGSTSEFGMIHWELAISNADSYAGDRLCPMTYFDQRSLTRIDAIWNKTPLEVNKNMRATFPDICNGAYRNHNEPAWVLLKK